MSLKIFDCAQGTDEWYRCKLGIVSASEFHTVLAQGKEKGADSKTRAKLMRRLAAERLTGEPHESYSNAYMERGKLLEAEARSWYAFSSDVELQQVGFCYREELDAGASPDSLIAHDGCLEVKTRTGDLQIELLEDDRVPPEHVAQIQGQLWITARQWVDFVSYSKGLPPFCKRVFRDEAYIARLSIEVEKFNGQLRTLVQRIAA
jgi:YqaJ-like viral recombinase domain